MSTLSCEISNLDYQTLYSLYNLTSGGAWTRINANQIWSFPSTLAAPCSTPWQGLTCEISGLTSSNQPLCSILGIELSDNGLVGYLPDQLSTMTTLTDVDFSKNKLHGDLPSSWSSLVNMINFNVGATDLSYELPSSWSTMSQIVTMQVYTSSFSGTLPESWSTMSLMKTFVGHHNFLTKSLPDSWSALSLLDFICLSTNLFTGTLPDSWSTMTMLEDLYLYQNMFQGALPTSWSSFSKIDELYLFDNQLTGTIPDSYSALQNIGVFYLSQNSFVGTLPDSFSVFSYLHSFSLHDNHFTGSLPDAWTSMTNIDCLYIYNNHLTGTLPESWSILSKMYVFLLYGNEFIGSIPHQWSTFTDLELIYLGSNYLEGTLPTSWGVMNGLVGIDVSGNLLTGVLPETWSSMTALNVMIINSNNFHSTLPIGWSNLRSLSMLASFNNGLTGNLPNSYSSLRSLQILYLQSNSLSGSLPDSWSALKSLNEILIYANQLSGVLSLSLEDLEIARFDSNHFTGVFAGYFPSIHYFNVSNNYFTGHVNSIFSNLQQITNIDASSNMLSGELTVPYFHNLTSVALADNCFTGTVSEHICNLRALHTIVLDNLANGVKCKGYINSPLYERFMKGSIPECLYTLPNLKTLRLIGNGLGGTLPEISSNSSLSIVGLMSNYISGTIPLSWQRHGYKWQQLLLSFNKLSGHLSNDFQVDPQQVQFMNLSLNRLSGDIPSGFQDLHTMSVVEGNIFSCHSQYSNDENAKSYSCGSIELTVVFYMFVTALGVIIMYFMFNKSMLAETLPIFSAINIHHSRRFVMYTLVLLGFVFVVYEVLSRDPGSSLYAIKYGWDTTAAFLKGFSPISSITLATFEIIFMVYIFMVEPYHITQAPGEVLNNLHLQVSMSDIFNFRCISLQMVNIVVVSSATFIYIYLILSQSSAVQLLFSIFLALFKVTWNFLFVNKVFVTAAERETNDSKHLLSISFLNELIADMFGFLICPLIVILTTEPNCFKYTIYEIPNVLTLYNFNTTQKIFTTSVQLVNVTIVETTYSVTLEETTMQAFNSISPPWLYSYQCSSAIIKSYVSVIFYSYLLFAIIHPVIKLFVYFGKERNNYLYFMITDLQTPISNFHKPDLITAFIEENGVKNTSMIHRRLIRHLVLLALFGLAAPCLGLVIVFTIFVEDVLVEAQLKVLWRDLLATGLYTKSVVKSMVDRVFLEHIANVYYLYLPFCMMIAVTYWTLFVFDTIADVHGNKQGTSAAVSYISVTSLALLILRLNSSWFTVSQSTRETVNEVGMELKHIEC